jgi:hypothetical protein
LYDPHPEELLFDLWYGFSMKSETFPNLPLLDIIISYLLAIFKNGQAEEKKYRIANRGRIYHFI